jgi:mannitol/fructose-specific phosphotransferase system IIA component
MHLIDTATPIKMTGVGFMAAGIILVTGVSATKEEHMYILTSLKRLE